MLFIFNLINHPPSLFIRFSSPLQCHFECFSERVKRINICDASFNRKMSPLTPPRSVIRQVTGHVDIFRFTCRRYESESVNVCVSRRAAREEKENVWKKNYRQEWSMEFDRKDTSRESMTRRWKALFRDCYCRDFIILVMPAVSWRCRTPQCGHFVKDDIGEILLVLVTIY